MAADLPTVTGRAHPSVATVVDLDALLDDAPALLLRWDDRGRCSEITIGPAARGPGHDATGIPDGDGPAGSGVAEDGAAGHGPARDRPGGDGERPAPSAVLGADGWLDLFHPDDADRAVGVVRSVLSGGGAAEEGVRLRSGRRWAVLRATNDRGGAVGALVDATRSLGDATRLARLTEGFNRLRRPEEIVRWVLDEGLALLGGVAATIHVLSDRGDRLLVAGSAGIREDVLREHSGVISLDAPLPASEVLQTGRPVIVRSHAERRARYPGLDDLLPVSFTPAFAAVPLFDVDGRPFGVLGIGFPDENLLPDPEAAFALDVAAHCALALDRARMTAIAERNAERLTFLNDLNESLSSSLGLRATLNRLAGVIVPRLGDWCAVRVRRSRDDRAPVVGAAHVDPALAPELAELAARIPRDLERAGELGAALAGTRPLIRRSDASDVFAGLVGRGGDERLASVGVEAVAVFPLTARGRLLGAIAFGNRPGRPLTDDDVALAEAVVSRSATLVDNARLFDDQSAVAHALQDSLLPGSLPTIPGLELGASYRPAGGGLDVGGDFYDAFQADSNWWVVAVGDVCGHGVEAAAMTGLVRHTIRAAALAGVMPSVILTRLNEMLLRQAAERTHWRPGVLPVNPRFCTVLVGAVQSTPRGVDIILCLGGHPAPLVRRTDGEVGPVGVPGTLLGVTPDVSLVDTVVHLDPGEALVCFTDGLTERRSGRDLFGEEGVARVLSEGHGLTAPVLAGLVEAAAVAHVADEPADDMAVLTLVAQPAR